MDGGELIVEKPVFSREGDRYQVEARLRGPGWDRVLWFRSSLEIAQEEVFLAEAFAGAALLVAMRAGWDLRVKGSVSAKFMEGLRTVMDVTHTWWPEFQVIDVLPEAVVDEVPVGADRGTMFCFSGGADSFHTYLENEDRITHGLVVFGADITLDETPYRDFAALELSRAADEMGVVLVEVDTNLVEVTGEHCEWAKHQHGGGLASIGKLFGDRLGGMLIASSYTVDKLLPWGSFPFVDPLWSGAGFEVEHFGAYTRRAEKVARVAESEIALRHLRVCFANEPGSLNCGECEKCLRTMCALRAAGAMGRCRVFSKELDLEAVRLVQHPSISAGHDWRSCLRVLEDGRDPELAEAIEAQVESERIRRANLDFGRMHEALLASDRWRDKLPKRRVKLLNSLKGHDAEWFAGELAKEVDAQPEVAFEVLWERRREWLKRKLREAERERWRQRFRAALRKIGIG